MRSPEGKRAYWWRLYRLSLGVVFERSCSGEACTLSASLLVPDWVQQRCLYYGDLIAVDVKFHAGV